MGHFFLPQKLLGTDYTNALALTHLLSQGVWRRSRSHGFLADVLADKLQAARRSMGGHCCFRKHSHGI